MYKAGADFGLISANTCHFCFEKVQKRSPIPLINIIDTTAEAIKKEKFTIVGLLGTSFTMNKPFYKDRLMTQGIKTITPQSKDIKYIDKVICGELAKGKFLPKSRKGFLRIIKDLKKRGAQGVILGCTEISLLVCQKDTPIKLFDTASIHIQNALDFMKQKTGLVTR